jgi:4-hydroxybenzoyl-CoA thioesterase
LSAAAPFRYVHDVRFDEVDAAGVAFFARFFGWCHDAMAAMLGGLQGGGGYHRLVTEQGLGLPVVHIEADFAAPLRFGDGVTIEVTVERMGESSVTLRFRLERAQDGSHVATIRHVIVLTALATFRPVALTADLRALLAAHTSEG